MRTLGMVASALVVCVAAAGSTPAAGQAAPRGPVSPSKKPTPIPIALPATTLELANRGGAVGEKVSLSATLRTSRAGVAIQGHEVKFRVAGAPACSAKTNPQGVATCSWTVPKIPQGIAPFEAGFEGDDVLGPSKAVAQFLAAKALTKLVLGSTSYNAPSKGVQPGGTLSVHATLTRKTDGAKLDGRVLSFTVNGRGGGTATTVKGVASIQCAVPRSIEGDAHLEVFFAGDDFSVGSSDQHVYPIWHVHHGYLNILTAESGQVGETLRFAAQLTRIKPMSPHMSSAGGIEGQPVNFTFTYWNGQAWVIGWTLSGVTDATGTAHASGRPQVACKTLSVWMAQDSDWLADEVQMPVSMALARTRITMPERSGRIGEPVTLKAHVTHAATGAPRSGVSVTFDLGGAPLGSKSTDASGDATLEVQLGSAYGVGTHTVNARVADDFGYYGGLGAAKLTIEPRQ
jgi:hypothetical protein